MNNPKGGDKAKCSTCIEKKENRGDKLGTVINETLMKQVFINAKASGEAY